MYPPKYLCFSIATEPLPTPKDTDGEDDKEAVTLGNTIVPVEEPFTQNLKVGDVLSTVTAKWYQEPVAT